ncbi:hypothetical protein BY458DRAFT_535376 [Sporodiniella umbellata]|nr:hypothetical protein BY458DRAFT_535376 [Sporodiniella umbellata]
MPYDTVKRSTKRIRANLSSFSEEEDNDWHNTTIEFFNQKSAVTPYSDDWNSYVLENSQSSVISSPPIDGVLPVTPSTMPIDIPYSSSLSEPLDSASIDNTTPLSPSMYWPDDYFGHSIPRTSISTEATMATLQSPSTPRSLDSFVDLNTVNPRMADMLSKIQLFYTESGINMEAKVTNASDLRTLVDAFSHLCCNDSDPKQEAAQPAHKIVLYRNKTNRTKPVNFFASTSDLGLIRNPHSSIGSDRSLREIADACIDTFFHCWVRFKPVLKKEEFMAWYRAQERPMETLIVNAICSHVFRHMVLHHSRPELAHFLTDQDRLQEQEEYFYSRARECLDQSFDTPDRYTIVALLFMSVRAESSKRHHYVGIASSALHALGIYPRMKHEEVDCYEKEMDTRLWWFVWAIDFSLWTAGTPKNTPQPRGPGQVDLPQVFEQDIDDTEIGVITFAHCLSIWKIQADIVDALYENDHSELTTEQLAEYDQRLLDFHHALPEYLKFDSGFEYGCADLFMACLRVNIEYNATRIILHKLFIPEMHDVRPSQAALASLRICLVTSLTQLSVIKTCNMVDVGRCAFDRDELWRAAEMISVALDCYHTCASPEDQARLIQGIQVHDFRHGLLKALDILRNTREYQYHYRNWLQVADWVQIEIRRHHLDSPTHRMKDDGTGARQPDFFSAHLKPHLLPLPPSSKTLKKQPKKIVHFQNQFSVASSSPTRKPTTSFVQFNPDPPEPKKQPQFVNGGKNQARFRYFNPRKMNKFLFIDEHPMM